MTIYRKSAAIFLVFVMACSDGTSPEGAGSNSFSFRVNGKFWQMTDVGLYDRGYMIGLNADRPVPNSSHKYWLSIGIDPFEGTGSYPLGTGTYPQGTAINGSRWINLFLVDSAGSIVGEYLPSDSAPGTLRITRYQLSDSSIAGAFHAVLYTQETRAETLVVDGAFRLHTVP